MGGTSGSREGRGGAVGVGRSVSSSSLSISGLLVNTFFFAASSAYAHACFLRLHPTQAPPARGSSQSIRPFRQLRQGGSYNLPDGRDLTAFLGYCFRSRGLGRDTITRSRQELEPDLSVTSDSVLASVCWSVSGRARCFPFAFSERVGVGSSACIGFDAGCLRLSVPEKVGVGTASCVGLGPLVFSASTSDGSPLSD